MRDLLNDARLVRYLLLNIIVSIVTALIVMFAWTFFVLRQPAGALEFSSASDAGASQLRVVTVVAAGDQQNEHVTIEHIGNQEIALAGWRLRDEKGNEFRFPALVLHPGGQVSIFTRKGDDTASALFWGRQAAMWSRGEELKLLDADGRLQATYTIP